METVKEKEQKGRASMEEMMRVFRELGTPGAPHKLLSRMEGNWKIMNRSWEEPGKPPVETAGASRNKMIFGGRYLQQEETGEMMGTAFNGLGISGYDNNSKKFFSAWIDTLSTAIHLFQGTASADGKMISMENRFNDPVRGPMTYRMELRFVDDDTYTFEMHGMDKNGKEEKMMESTYTREK